MPKISDITDCFEKRAPSYMKLDFDNVGLLAGFTGAEVGRALVALDITDGVIAEAREYGAGLIVSHHPLFFQLKSVSDAVGAGRRAAVLLAGNMAAVCLHTNLDAADGGVNDALMSALGAKVTGLLSPHGAHPDGRPFGVARTGRLPAPMELGAFLERTKRELRSNGLRYYDAGREVLNIGCCGGSGGEHIAAAAGRGCDTYVTADVKYDQFLTAAELGINLIDADHFCTENVVVPVIAGILKEAFPELEVKISESHKQTVKFF